MIRILPALAEAGVVFLSLLVSPVSAATITVTGTLVSGTDSGVFTEGSLSGQAFSVLWTVTDCDCSRQAGGSFYETSNPILEAVLTINGHDFDFGPGVYGVVSPTYQNVTVSSGSFAMNTYAPSPTGPGGGFILPGASGFFTVNSLVSDAVVVPAPSGLFFWRIRHASQ